MTSRSVTVVNELGLHARAAARFVHLATRFDSRIRVARDSKVMDGKSIMGILLLAAGRGTSLTITAEGPDEEAAADALARLVAEGFGEETWNG
jgi:phosphocarrier protein